MNIKQKTHIKEENIYQKTFGLFGLKTYRNKANKEVLTAGNYICSHNDTSISDPYERRESFERVEKK